MFLVTVFAILAAGVLFFGGTVSLAMHNSSQDAGSQVMGLLFVMVMVMILLMLAQLVTG